MTQLIKSTQPTLFPSELFTHILGYCDDTIEDKQKKNMTKVVNDFSQIFKVRNEEGIDNIMPECDEVERALLDMCVHEDVLFQLNCILITPVKIDGVGQDFQEIRTCTKVNETCTLNTYTKIGTICDESKQYFREGTLFTPLIYSQCTNY
tara:strand:+ start:382 stop:831 length:450 start_codon:yes stop_codon:yes gene_type:complete